MPIRSPNGIPEHVRLVRENALLDGRLGEVWNRYARSAALALRGSAGLVLLRIEGTWTLAGRFGETDGVHPGRLLEDLPVTSWSGRAPRSSAVAGAAMRVGGREWNDSTILAVLFPIPRAARSRDWEVLKVLADSLKNEVALRIQLASMRVVGGPEAGEPGLARLNLGGDLSGGLSAVLRHSILAAVHEGTAHAGDRLPSIREVADACDTTTYAVLQAYGVLEDEGIVEKRERSGVFIASLGETPIRRLPETATWLRSVVADGYLLQVKLPGLPDLIHRWTSSAPLRCACIEATEDYRVALAEEVRGHFGLDAIEIAAPSDESASGPRTDSMEGAVRRADLIVTTPFHLSRVRGLAARLDIPLVVATLDEPSGRVISRRLRSTGDVVLVCVDAEFGRRMTINVAPADRDRVRIVPIGSPALAKLDRSRPVLITRAARQHLNGEDLRLLLPQYPAFSRRFAERLAHTIIQLNLERMRRPAATH